LSEVEKLLDEGSSDLQAGNPQVARGKLEKALAGLSSLTATVNTNDPMSVVRLAVKMAQCTGFLGMSYLKTGDREQGLALIREAQDQMRKLPGLEPSIEVLDQVLASEVGAEASDVPGATATPPRPRWRDRLERGFFATSLVLSYLVLIRPWHGYWSGPGASWQWLLLLAIGVTGYWAGRLGIIVWGLSALAAMGSANMAEATALLVLGIVLFIAYSVTPDYVRSQLWGSVFFTVVLAHFGWGLLGILLFALLLSPAQAAAGAAISFVLAEVSNLLWVLRSTELPIPATVTNFHATTLSVGHQFRAWGSWEGSVNAGTQLGNAWHSLVPQLLFVPSTLGLLALWVACAASGAAVRNSVRRVTCIEGSLWACVVASAVFILIGYAFAEPAIDTHGTVPGVAFEILFMIAVPMVAATAILEGVAFLLFGRNVLWRLESPHG